MYIHIYIYNTCWLQRLINSYSCHDSCVCVCMCVRVCACVNINTWRVMAAAPVASSHIIVEDSSCVCVYVYVYVYVCVGVCVGVFVCVRVYVWWVGE